MNITQRDVASNELKTVVCAIPQAWGRGGEMTLMSDRKQTRLYGKTLYLHRNGREDVTGEEI